MSPVTYALRRATGCVGSSSRIFGSSVRAAPRPRPRRARAGTESPSRGSGCEQLRRQLREVRCAATASPRPSTSRSPASRRSSIVNSGSGATSGSRRAASHCDRHWPSCCDSGRSALDVHSSIEPFGSARAQQRRLRARAIDADLEPQHLVAARDAEQPVDRVLDLRMIRVEQRGPARRRAARRRRRA